MEVTVGDVGPRDGPQNEHATLEPALRAGLVAPEDLGYVPHGEGVDTAVDLDALIGVSAWLEGVPGRELPGRLGRAGAFAPACG